MQLLEIHTQNHSQNLSVDFDVLTPKSVGCQPTNLAGHQNAWVRQFRHLDGSQFLLTFAFSQEEAVAADELSPFDYSSLSWDAAHVVRVVARIK